MERNKGMTVKQLKKDCDRLIKEGLGDKHILISCDDEGNGFHTLFYLFTAKKESIDFYASEGMFHDNNPADEVVLLG